MTIAGQKTAGAAAPGNPELSAAIWVKSAVNADGLVGGVGIKPLDLHRLQQVLARPGGPQELLGTVLERLGQSLAEAGIVHGVNDEDLQAAAQAFLAAVAAGKSEALARRVAEGEAPQAGEPGWIEYPLNHRGLPFGRLAGLKPDSEEKRTQVVHAGEVLAVLHPAKDPVAGTSVRGEVLKLPAKGGAASLQQVAGEGTSCKGEQLVSEYDGLCEEDAAGGLRVIPQIRVPEVNVATGRIPGSGISEASIAVDGDLKGGFGVATSEQLFVGLRPQGAFIENNAGVQAKNLVLRGTASGAMGEAGAPIEVEELCAVGEVVNRHLSARRILVTGKSSFARLEADEMIWIGSSLHGGLLSCRRLVQVSGDLGSAGGASTTRVLLPQKEKRSRAQRRQAVALKKYREQLELLRAQLAELSGQCERRVKADPYWARLVKGEVVPPQGALQVNAYRQFGEYNERRASLERQLAAIGKAVRRLAAAPQETTEEQAECLSVMVGGTVHPDVCFEIVRELKQEELATQVSFVHEGQRFRNHTLGDVRNLLQKQVKAYLEGEGAQVEERRAALAKMYEGQSARPAGPDLQDRSFTQEVSWATEGDARMEFKTVICVHALDPQKVTIHSTAQLREPVAKVTVTLQAQGARGCFTCSANTNPVPVWHEDSQLVRELEGLVVCGVNALEVLRGDAAG